MLNAFLGGATGTVDQSNNAQSVVSQRNTNAYVYTRLAGVVSRRVRVYDKYRIGSKRAIIIVVGSGVKAISDKHMAQL